MAYDIFITLRFIAWCITRGECIKELLEAVGFTVYLASLLAGDNIDDDVIENLHTSKMALILGSETYGEATKSKVNTKKELGFILDKEKPFFLLKMCKHFNQLIRRF